MKKIVVIAALAVLVVVLPIVMFAFGGSREENVPETETAVTNVETGSDTETDVSAEETIIPSTEPMLPGLEDSIFDDEDEETIEATEPAEATPPQKQDGNSIKPTEPKPVESKPTESKPIEPEPNDPRPTEPKPNDPEPNNPNPSNPRPTEPEPNDPESDTPESDAPESDAPESEIPSVDEMDYEKFQNLTPSEQQSFVESFDSMDEFFDWYNAAREAYEQDNAPIEVDGPIDIGAIIEGEG